MQDTTPTAQPSETFAPAFIAANPVETPAVPVAKYEALQNALEALQDALKAIDPSEAPKTLQAMVAEKKRKAEMFVNSQALADQIEALGETTFV